MSQSNRAPVSAFDPIAMAASVAAIAAGQTGSTAAPAKDKATVYLGIGTLREGADITSENFDPSKDLINLPQMTGLDNMREDDRKAGTQEFANQQLERNEFLRDLKEQALSSLAPGETVVLPLYVTVYRKRDDVVAEVAPASRPKVNFFG